MCINLLSTQTDYFLCSSANQNSQVVETELQMRRDKKWRFNGFASSQISSTLHSTPKKRQYNIFILLWIFSQHKQCAIWFLLNLFYRNEILFPFPFICIKPRQFVFWDIQLIFIFALIQSFMCNVVYFLKKETNGYAI